MTIRITCSKCTVEIVYIFAIMLLCFHYFCSTTFWFTLYTNIIWTTGYKILVYYCYCFERDDRICSLLNNIIYYINRSRQDFYSTPLGRSAIIDIANNRQRRNASFFRISLSLTYFSLIFPPLATPRHVLSLDFFFVVFHILK